eukprot:CAMPEP_0119433048 /NCGR_PEP_ID=MMETSP1335-20130426/48954_1 /TAXON_ID=259385 /ORGANISM="Chrysoculter rhomboideus, Strain RCC1486" /LENGTH=55 /DNA_ID=CAMNT_0007458883 /DNA_START=466 /DNA_END=630 /DNA_ORIENTATION=-
MRRWLPPPASHRARASAMAGIAKVFAGIVIISFVVGISLGVAGTAAGFSSSLLLG